MKGNRFKLNKYGFTIVELIITIAIILILAAVAVPSYFAVVNKAKTDVDNASLVILNNATVAYAMAEHIQMPDIFDDIEDDALRMQKLVSEKYLAAVVSPQQEDAEFNWSVASQIWQINGIDGSGVPDSPEDEGNAPPAPEPTATPGPDADLSQYPLWDADTIYETANNYVVYNGKLYYNLWWVDKTLTPGSSQVWQQVSDEWVFFNIYNTGDTVEYDGHTYRARFWTSGVTPVHSQYDAWELIE